MSLKAAFILVCLGTSIISIGPASAARSPKSQQPSTPVAHQDATNDLSVVVGRSIILDCASPIQRVSLGLGGVAEATVITHTEILLNGKAAGETSLILWEKGGNREFFNVTVRPSQAGSDDRLDSLRRELKKELPGQTLKISSENGSIFLSGTVHDLESSARAERIAAVDGKVVNLLNVEVPLAEPQI